MRIKRSLHKRQKHTKVLKLAKGYRQSYSKLYKRAKEAITHAGQYSYEHRQHRRAQMRVSWTKIISAALSNTGVSYNVFIHNLKQKNVTLDRKILAEIAQMEPKHFESLVETVGKTQFSK